MERLESLSVDFEEFSHIFDLFLLDRDSLLRRCRSSLLPALEFLFLLRLHQVSVVVGPSISNLPILTSLLLVRGSSTTQGARAGGGEDYRNEVIVDKLSNLRLVSMQIQLGDCVVSLDRRRLLPITPVEVHYRLLDPHSFFQDLLEVVVLNLLKLMDLFVLKRLR